MPSTSSPSYLGEGGVKDTRAKSPLSRTQSAQPAISLSSGAKPVLNSSSGSNISVGASAASGTSSSGGAMSKDLEGASSTRPQRNSVAGLPSSAGTSHSRESKEKAEEVARKVVS